MTESIPSELAKKIGLVVLDVDGVLTDGGVYMGGDRGQVGNLEMKRFDVQDGLGIRIAFVIQFHYFRINGSLIGFIVNH